MRAMEFFHRPFFSAENEVEIEDTVCNNKKGSPVMLKKEIEPGIIHARGIACAVFLLLGSWAFESAAAADSFIAFELEVDENRLDGCTDCGCRLKGELIPGEKQEWWVSFGLVGPDEKQSWRATGSPSHCGPGSFTKTEQDFKKTIGIPYVVLQLQTRTKPGKSKEVRLEVELDHSQFADFGKNNEAGFKHTKLTRNFVMSDGARSTIPVLIPDSYEADAFQVNEVLLNLWAEELANLPPASYGAIAVSADVPGAVVLLDEGIVGRILEDNPLLIEHVLTGKREIRVKDFSGREVTKSVRVKEEKTTEMTLNVLDLEKAAHSNGLVSLGKNQQGYNEYWRLKDGAMMVEVPAGPFLMGSPEGKGEPDERPQRELTLPGFLIDKTEVTWRQFQKYASAANRRLPPDPVWGVIEYYPISFVLYREAAAFCKWAGGRLPSEAEWEKAARGTDGRIYPWGEQWDATRCNSIAGGMHRPEAVGSFPSCLSPYGALDMAGNKWEWTSDRYAAYSLDGQHDGDNSEEETERLLRTLRGGAWMNPPSWLRSAYRLERSTRSRNMDHGFRCVTDLGVSE